MADIHITNNFNAPVGQHIDHVDRIDFRMDGDGNFSFGHVDEMGMVKNKPSNASTDIPTAARMAEAVEKTIRDGYWWGNTAWCVVFRVMQMMGYKGSQTDFVREVDKWPFSYAIQYKCNIDSVGKPLRKGTMVRDVEYWQQDGAQPQYVRLANELMKILQ